MHDWLSCKLVALFAKNCRLPALALASIILGFVGCGGPSIPRTEPVSGTVTLKGKAIEGVEVYFVNEKLVSFGKTDSQGRYDLVQGAVAGENKVYFSKIEGGAKTDSSFKQQEGMDDYQLQMAATSGTNAKASISKQVIPEEYSNAATPKLNFLVPGGGTKTADFKL